MKKMNTLFLLLFSVIIIFTLQPEVTFANKSDNYIDIATNPRSELFVVSNFAPGDWTSRKLTIQNIGKQDINYSANINFITGSEKFFRHLELKVVESEQVVFDGKLSDFKGFSKRPLDSMTDENLIFRIGFPEKSDNGYQGLSVKFAIEFDADGGISPTSGSSLPDTATNVLSFLFIGVSFLALGFILYLGLGSALSKIVRK